MYIFHSGSSKRHSTLLSLAFISNTQMTSLNEERTGSVRFDDGLTTFLGLVLNSLLPVIYLSNRVFLFFQLNIIGRPIFVHSTTFGPICLWSSVCLFPTTNILHRPVGLLIS